MKIFNLIFSIIVLSPNLFALISSNSEYSIDSAIISNSGGEYISGGDYMIRGASGQNISSDAQTITRNNEYSNRSGFYNPPYFTYQKKIPVNFKNSEIELNIPSDSIDKEVFDVFLNKNAESSNFKDIIEKANEKVKMNKGILSFPLVFNELGFMDEESFYRGNLKNKGLLAYHISDADKDGNVDGTNPPVRISSLRGYLLDEEEIMWLKCFDNSLMVESLKVNFSFTKPGIYSLMGEIEDSVKDVYAYPVPFRPNGPNRGNDIGQTGTEEKGITFANIPQNGNIEIWTIDGKLVKDISIPLNLTEPKLNWDVKNKAGEKVASGIYIWRVVSGKNSKTGKLVIIR